MKIHVTFSESTTRVPARFADLQIITNGVAPEEVEKLVADGEKRGFAAGRQAEHDSFWDVFQQNGARTDYSNAFRSAGWTDASFKPKYDMRPVGGSALVQYMFYQTGIADLAGILESRGVVLDVSGVDGIVQMFQYAKVTHIPALDLRNATGYNAYAFHDTLVETIDKLIVSEKTNIANTMFQADKKLKNITFEGTIGVSINFQWSPLTKASIESVVGALWDAATEKSATFQKAAVNAAFETAPGKADGSVSEEWLALVATKPNWTISLV